jgi:hypothetical protein
MIVYSDKNKPAKLNEELIKQIEDKRRMLFEKPEAAAEPDNKP